MKPDNYCPSAPHFMWQRLFGGGVFVFYILTHWLCSDVNAQPTHQRLIYAHSLLNATPVIGETIVNSGGAFVSGKGWQATTTASQLRITLPDTLPYEGTFVINVTNFDPVSQCQTIPDTKLHIINLYSRIYTNNKDIFDTDGSWCNIRTGTAYSTGPGMAGFKFLAAPRGIDTRLEIRCIEDHTWNLSQTYEFKITWTNSRIYCFFDGQLMANFNFAGQVERFKYILIGKDNLIWGYAAQPGPIYSNVRIYTTGNPVVCLKTKIFMEGAYDANTHAMLTRLKTDDRLPLESPYTQAPKSVSSIPAGITDWALLSLREQSSGPSVAAKSVWLRNDGWLIDPDTGGDQIEFPLIDGDYYIVVQHRNHLDAMSAAKVSLNGLSCTAYDFSTGTNKYLNNVGAGALETNVYGCLGGDIDQNGQLTTQDYIDWFNQARGGGIGYYNGDVNLDGHCTTSDYVIWFNNTLIGASSGLP